jgi:hypothetical protein
MNLMGINDEYAGEKRGRGRGPGHKEGNLVNSLKTAQPFHPKGSWMGVPPQRCSVALGSGGSLTTGDERACPFRWGGNSNGVPTVQGSCLGLIAQA